MRPSQWRVPPTHPVKPSAQTGFTLIPQPLPSGVIVSSPTPSVGILTLSVLTFIQWMGRPHTGSLHTPQGPSITRHQTHYLDTWPWGIDTRDPGHPQGQVGSFPPSFPWVCSPPLATSNPTGIHWYPYLYIYQLHHDGVPCKDDILRWTALSPPHTLRCIVKTSKLRLRISIKYNN